MDTRDKTGSKSLLAALHEKYGDNDLGEEQAADSFFEIFIPAKAPGNGASDSLRLPSCVGLESYGIQCTGDMRELSTVCANVKELNLSDNCIDKWHEVFAILDTIPKLELINLTRNPLPQLDKAATDKSYPLLKKLVLNFTNLTWETVGNLLSVIPHLEELYLSGNSYEGVMLDIPAYDSLRLLQLTDNRLSDWKDIVNLDRLFPRLQKLILADNNISSCGSGEENSSIFTSLSVLNMNNTVISEWNELDKLSAIKSVSDIRLASIPLVEGVTDRRKVMQLLSVHFPRLRLVNGSPVDNELETAERIYIRHFEECGIRPDKFTELESKHGKLQSLAEVDMTPPFSVSLMVVCGDKEEVWDIPMKQTIGQLKKCLRPFVGTSEFELTFPRGVGLLTDHFARYTNNRPIHTYRLQDGDKIVCVKMVD